MLTCFKNMTCLIKIFSYIRFILALLLSLSIICAKTIENFVRQVIILDRSCDFQCFIIWPKLYSSYVKSQLDFSQVNFESDLYFQSEWDEKVDRVFTIYRVIIFFWMLFGLSFFGSLISLMSRSMNRFLVSLV